MYKLNEFCNIITKLRKEKGLTQTALAEKLGISAQSISKWECGRRGLVDEIQFLI